MSQQDVTVTPVRVYTQVGKDRDLTLGTEHVSRLKREHRTLAGLAALIAGETDPPVARGQEVERRRPGWIALAALCDAHIAAHPDIVPALAAKWGMA